MGLIVARPRSGGGSLVVKEQAIGDIDGINREFTTTFDYYPDTLTVYYRGLREGFVEPLGNKRFRMPIAPRIGSPLWVEYVQW